MNKQDTKHLYKKNGRTIWTIRYRVPPDVQYAFLNANGKVQKEITKSTGTTDLSIAQKKRDIFIGGLSLKTESIRTGDKSLLFPLAQVYKKDIKQIKKDMKVNPDASELIDPIREDALERVKELNLVDASPEEIKKAMKTPEGYISEGEALQNLDKSGKVKAFYDEVLGKSFDAYIDEWAKRRSNQVGSRYVAEGISTIKKFKEFHSTLTGVSWAVVQQWVDILGQQNVNSRTIRGYMTNLKHYWKHVIRMERDKDAEDINAFTEHEIPTSHHAVRKAWESEDVRRLLQTETITIKNKPILKDLIMIGMFTGARIEEICQLQKKDVVLKNNIKCLYIDKSKTDRHHNFGKRNTPIHSKLDPIIVRLLEQLDNEEEYLIPITTKVIDGKRSTALSKNFGYHKKYLGFSSKQTNATHSQELRDFHSLRTTVNSFLRNKKVEQKHREVICGWSKAFKNQSMAETAYNDMEMSYPYHERKKDVELLTELYDWL